MYLSGLKFLFLGLFCHISSQPQWIWICGLMTSRKVEDEMWWRHGKSRTRCDDVTESWGRDVMTSRKVEDEMWWRHGKLRTRCDDVTESWGRDVCPHMINGRKHQCKQKWVSFRILASWCTFLSRSHSFISTNKKVSNLKKVLHCSQLTF